MIVGLFVVFVGPEIYFYVKQNSAAKLLRDQNNSLACDFDLEQYPDWKDNFPPVRSKLGNAIRRLTGTNFGSPVVRLFLQNDSPESIRLISHLRHLIWLQITSLGGDLHNRPVSSLKPIESAYSQTRHRRYKPLRRSLTVPDIVEA